jgi:hypothetical protein
MLEGEGEHGRVGSGALSCAELRMRENYKSIPARHETQQNKMVARTVRRAVML